MGGGGGANAVLTRLLSTANVYTVAKSHCQATGYTKMNKRQKTAQINLRVLPQLKDEAEKAAAEDHRSLTSLIEKLLADYLQRRRQR